jgi:hypothetical protein
LKTLATLLAGLLGLPLLLTAAMAAIGALALQNEPRVGDAAPVDYQAVADSKALLKRALQQIESRATTVTMAVSEQELKNLARMGSRSLLGLNADVAVREDGVHSVASLALPANPLGSYLNISLNVAESPDELRIDELRVGSLSLPGGLLLPTIELAARYILPDEDIHGLLNSITGVAVEGKTVRLSLSAPANAKSDIKQVVKRLQASRFPAGEQARVSHYYDLLAVIAPPANFDPRSLDQFIVPVMKEAALLSEQGNAVVENRAAIWALAIYFSYGAFEKLVGDLVSDQRRLVYPALNVTLDSRRDLMLHFIYSAGITLATQQGIGIAAGEFKELLDSGGGGSGFSFVDLAADRAGVQFALSATGSETRARHVQQMIAADNGEGSYFPAVSGLQEGLSEAAFKQQFGDTQSVTYQAQVEQIDQRIQGLPVHRSGG